MAASGAQARRFAPHLGLESLRDHPRFKAMLAAAEARVGTHKMGEHPPV